MSDHPIDEVILIVGGNPLPNYVAARALQRERDITRTRLFYTKEVEDVRQPLARALKDAGIDTSYKFIEDAASAYAVRAAATDLARTHMHYSGGTNVMAVHLCSAWRGDGGQDEDASYLDGLNDRLVTDAGTTISLDGISLDLLGLANLHGLTRWQPRKPVAGGPTLADASVVAKAAAGSPRVAWTLFARVENPALQPITPPDLPNGLGLNRWPDPGQTGDQNKAWGEFLGGMWLEDFVGDLIPSAIVKEVGVTAWRGPRDFEVDVVAIRGYRIYVVSCTVSGKAPRCKQKLFEVAMRARQLGGDLARSALVCLADKDGRGRNVVDQLRRDVHSISESFRTPAVFGLADFRQWVGVHGRPETRTLTDWLQS